MSTSLGISRKTEKMQVDADAHLGLRMLPAWPSVAEGGPALPTPHAGTFGTSLFDKPRP